MKSATYSFLVGRLPHPLHLDRVGGRVLVRHSRLVGKQHGGGPEHVAERVVEQVEDGGGVQVGVPVEKSKTLCSTSLPLASTRWV